MAALQQGTQQMPQIEDIVKQQREFISQYNKLVESCFNDCVNDYTSRSLLKSETTCSTNCVEKSLKKTQRISERFLEHQMMGSQDPNAAVQALTK
ncbi:mitochondrial import inner membrane translocase subunit Tim9-like [Mya arenaria]|uniref:mitochondrial import inner membrane translocase subunit Tim9-like n=1 Tax=Mya arenaria TaxID=6604 RepID=UPI0022E5059C|nr:mitochondrial import inner membrane translocase subunit Tim9-like [Mya arenaria]XP_052767633.1 mitochondrial import inner membrane translocase subunit Tim9-like [Mya arenaria]